MRRIVMTAVAAISLAAPSAALAHNGERHHHHHRGRHHGHAHVLAFHAQAPASPTQTTGAPTSSGESAGTIVSFENNVLTIKLSDGSTVAGKVTEQTEIECAAPTGSSSAGQSSFGEHEHGDDANFANGPHDGSWDDRGEGDDRNGCPGHEENGQRTEHCTTAALVPGATVQDALLLVSGQGAGWLKVEL